MSMFIILFFILYQSGIGEKLGKKVVKGKENLKERL